MTLYFPCTGSMCGNRIQSAKEALFLFLKSLPADCYFNVISFGSSYSSLFKLYVFAPYSLRKHAYPNVKKISPPKT